MPTAPTAVLPSPGLPLLPLQAQLERKQYPLATVGAAIVLAAEMNTVRGCLLDCAGQLGAMEWSEGQQHPSACAPVHVPCSCCWV